MTQTGDDGFVHFSGIQIEGRHTLHEGRSGEFEVRDSTKGPCAEKRSRNPVVGHMSGKRV